MPPIDPNDAEHITRDLKMEREAREELVRDNGRPCYPIELGFEVFRNPGQYKDMFEYWQRQLGAGGDAYRLIFHSQLQRWKVFRHFQQRNRLYFVSRCRFSDFQRQVLERRRRHGLHGDVILSEEQTTQSLLDEWMEYQDYELRLRENFQKSIEQTQTRLASNRKKLAEAGISAFEGIQELEFAGFYSKCLRCDGEEFEAEKEKQSAELKLRLAEKRLDAARSSDLGETVERAAWIRLFQMEFESAQTRLNETHRLYEEVSCVLSPYNAYVYLKSNELTQRRDGDIEEWENAEFDDQKQKQKELIPKAAEARKARDGAKEEVAFADEGLKAARLDDFERLVAKAALLKVVEEEVRSAQTKLKNAREMIEIIKLKRKISSELHSMLVTKGKIKRHNVWLEWVEQQRREIAVGHTDTKKERSQGPWKNANSRVLRDRPATKASKPNKARRASGPQQKQPTARILGPVDPGRVSKAPSKRRRPPPKMSVPCDILQQAKRTSPNPSTSKSQSKQARKVNDPIPAPLRPIHSSRVSKSGRGGPSRLRRAGTHQLADQSTNASPRRSTRKSNRPNRFCPDYT